MGRGKSKISKNDDTKNVVKQKILNSIAYDLSKIKKRVQKGEILKKKYGINWEERIDGEKLLELAVNRNQYSREALTEVQKILDNAPIIDISGNTSKALTTKDIDTIMDYLKSKGLNVNQKYVKEMAKKHEQVLNRVKKLG